MKKLLVSVGVMLLFCALLHAEAFKILGARALGMGGAYVAVVGEGRANSSALTQYWNPAGLANNKGVDVHIPIDAGVEATGGILKHANEIADSAAQLDAVSDAQTSGTYLALEQLKTFTEALEKLKKIDKPGMGLTATAVAGANISVGRWAVSMNNYISGGVDPRIDLDGIFLGSATVAAIPTMHMKVAKLVEATKSADGVDFSQIPNIATLVAEPSSAGLSSASDDLATTLTDVQDTVGFDMGGYTPDQIANALINLADSQGTSEADIVASVEIIHELKDLVDSLVGNKTFTDNQSNLTIRGLVLNEISVGHGRNASFIHPMLKDLSIGMNLKYMKGTVGFARKMIMDEATKSDNLLDDLNDVTKESTAFGVDLGFLYDRKNDYYTKVGLLLRNINSPSFDYPQAGKDAGFDSYAQDAQMRLGVAVWPLNWISLSCDMDLTENKTPIDGYTSKLLSLGTEINLLNKGYMNLALRGGMYQNTAYGDIGRVYTGGLGLNIIHFMLEVAGSVSQDTVQIEDGDEIPASSQISIALGLNF